MTINVSVIIPFYKRQSVFDQTMKSVLGQSQQPREIIIVNDGSGDDSSQYLSQYKDLATIIDLPDNHGVSEARNIGANLARGKYIAFIDSDDIWEPQKLELQYNYMENNPDVDLLHTGCCIFGDSRPDAEYNDKPSQLTVDDLVHSAQVMFQSVMMKTHVFRQTGGFDPRFRQTEDWELSVRLAKEGYSQHFLNKTLVKIRRGEQDHLSQNWRGYLSGHWGVMMKFKSLFRRHLGFHGYYQRLFNYLDAAGYKQNRWLGKGVIVLARSLKTINRLSLIFASKPPIEEREKDYEI